MRAMDRGLTGEHTANEGKEVMRIVPIGYRTGTRRFIHLRRAERSFAHVEASGKRIWNLYRWLRRRSRPGPGQSDGRRRYGAAQVGLRHEDVPEDGRLRRIADR